MLQVAIYLNNHKKYKHQKYCLYIVRFTQDLNNQFTASEGALILAYLDLLIFLNRIYIIKN